MSIEQELGSHFAGGKLRLVTPRVPSDQSLRKLYLTRELFDEVYEEKEGLYEIEMFANLTADLEVFVTSNTIDPGYLRCLKPCKNGVWEIRSTRHEPQIRVFGVFAAKDIFIGTHYKLREDLGNKHSGKWEIEIKYAESVWKSLFPGYAHKTTSDLNQLFRGALNERYFK